MDWKKDGGRMTYAYSSAAIEERAPFIVDFWDAVQDSEEISTLSDQTTYYLWDTPARDIKYNIDGCIRTWSDWLVAAYQAIREDKERADW